MAAQSRSVKENNTLLCSGTLTGELRDLAVFVSGVFVWTRRAEPREQQAAGAAAGQRYQRLRIAYGTGNRILHKQTQNAGMGRRGRWDYRRSTRACVCVCDS